MLDPVYEVIYNSVLVGSAVLCLARGVLGRGERLAWTVIGVSLALWATGNLYWQFALSDLAEAPYPSVADGFWLAFLPVCYLGVLLLARKRMPQLDSRLWLDGIIAALTTGAISAAVIFGAVHASTGGDSAAVATNLAYPLGDMILLGTVIGAMTAGRGRLDRSWLYFGAGIAVFAVTDSIYLLQIAEGHLRRRHAARRRMDRGHAAGRARRLAARRAQARHRRRAPQHHHADRARAGEPRAAGL